MIVKSNALKTFIALTDQTPRDGYFVDAAGVLMASATVAPFGVITDGGAVGGLTTAAVSAGGYRGTLRVKLKASGAGSIAVGTALILVNDGTVKATAGASGSVIVATALEAGVDGELIEAVLMQPVIIPA